MQFSIEPWFRNIILKELKNLSFLFRFYETTISQIKKQYDAYAIYHSRHFGQTVTAHFGTLFVGRCTVDYLLCHLYELPEKTDLSPDCIIPLDRPNVNLSFKRKLENDLSKKDRNLVDVGSCPLYTCSNSFLKGLKVLTLESDKDFDQFVIDLFGFSKRSVKQNQELFWGRNIHRPPRKTHDEARVHTCVHFLRVHPTEKEFNGKYGIRASDQYKRIKKTLNNKTLPAIAFTVIFFALDFKIISILWQLKQPMIIVLYSKMVKFVKKCLSKFFLDGSFTTNRESLKSMAKLRELDSNALSLQKVWYISKC